MAKKGITVGLNINNKSEDFNELMIELENLCSACDIDVVGSITQNAKQVNRAFYIGTGKVEELLNLIKKENIEIVIFYNELSTSQLKNLEEKLNCEIIDRTALILDIFAQRAKTREAKLQVEVASLKYMLPRLIGSNENLGRQSGGVGTKNRGSGEKKLELDRRRIEEKITSLNKELDDLKFQRETQRSMRRKSNLPNVALVGYTNAGKSSIMNKLVDIFKNSEEKKVFEKNMLFATLETSVRNIVLTNNKEFLLSDTVGFVSNLPHDLVKAFRSTLEEACEADVLLHVIDISNPSYKSHIKVTEDTLKQIGADGIHMIHVYNKIDLIDVEVLDKILDSIDKEGLFVSVKKDINIDKMIKCICDSIFKDYVRCKFLIPYDKGHVASYFNENTSVINTEYREDGALLDVECSNIEYNKYKKYVLE
ncbi:GTPase HflX [Clostridioides difficile]|uniref:GTPase HflX n=1 Tax=Clostridioides difficile TaxID=1496 RepID=UPI000892A81F|nr:GTPase HflX [Clostridioides difficile]AXU64936.1 GTP-binding protein [Clostridioides difficile]OFA18609.1 GTP-binding protein [Clostridioides difficile]SJO74487.1 GTP-binding protein HflX [Clostridioides difficile]SJP11857.1 GTP-binding protein HflX [Clostridioides difficile]VHY41258.1 GTP-binding protein, HflX type [Clostridioides difficile]